jgi:hypothetical protein
MMDKIGASRCWPSPGPGVAVDVERDGQLLTEHAVLDDNGDGKGVMSLASRGD